MSVNMYLSVNNAYQNGVTSNTTELLVVPVIPAKIKVNKPQNLQEFETVSLKKLSFIAPADLKSIEWESFFPCRDYPYVRGERLRAFDYVYTIDKWVEQKLPIRLIITGLDDNNPESIFMPCAVESFDYETGTDGDLYYSISFKEYPIDAGESDGDELLSKEYDELKALIETNRKNIEALQNGYETLDSIPAWAKPTVIDLMERGCIQGEGEVVVDEETGDTSLIATSNLKMTEQTLKCLVVSDRANAYRTRMVYAYNDANIPAYAKPLLSWLMSKGFIRGDSPDPENARMNLTDDMLNMLVVLARGGAFGDEARQIQQGADGS